MTIMPKEQELNLSKEQELLDSNVSAYNLYTINGCSQSSDAEEQPIFIGFYH